MNSRLYICFLCVLFVGVIHAQEFDFGDPYIKFFPPEIYQAGASNWAIAQDTVSGLIYFGNEEGLLEYDGTKWRIYYLRNFTACRSIYIESASGRIYVGGQGELGYFYPDKNDSLNYQSLIPLLNEAREDSLFADVWRILPPTDRSPYIQFITYQEVYNLNPKSNRFESSIRPKHKQNVFEFGFIGRGQKIVYEQESGLLEIIGKTTRTLKGQSELLKINPAFILPYPDDRLIIGNQSTQQMLYLYDGADATLLTHPKTQYALQDSRLYQGVQLPNGNYALGTRQAGIFVIDTLGQILQEINRDNGLISDNILALFVDNGGNLWVGTGSGIAQVTINSPVQLIHLENRWKTKGYSSAVFNEHLYLATENGLFYQSVASLCDSLGGDVFSHISDDFGEAWCLQTIDNRLFSGRHSGTYEMLAPDEYRVISEKEIGGWRFRNLTNNLGDTMLISGNYLGINFYQKNSEDNWAWRKKIGGFRESSRFVEIGSRGDLWVSHIYRGIYHFVKDEAGNWFLKNRYGQEHGFPSDYQINVFKIDSQILFGTEDGIYHFNNTTETFVQEPYWQQVLGENRLVSHMYEDEYDRVWYVENQKLRCLQYHFGAYHPLPLSGLNMLDGRLVDKFAHIHTLSENKVLIGTEEGYVLLDAAFRNLTPYPFQVLIREVTIGPSKNEIISYGAFREPNGALALHQLIENSTVIPHEKRDVRIAFSAPLFENPNRIEYRYYLKGPIKLDTSEWTAAPYAEFSKLSTGQYVFEVWARNGAKVVTDNPATYQFEVQRNPRTVLLYGVLSLLVLALVVRNWWLRRNVETQSQAIRQKDKMLNDIILVQTFEIPKLLKDAILVLQQISEKGFFQFQEMITELIEKLQKNLDKMEGLIEKWDYMEQYWVKPLMIDYPEINVNDIKLCSFILTHITTREIAEKEKITIGAVNNNKTKLRKKFKLSEGADLYKFLENYIKDIRDQD